MVKLQMKQIKDYTPEEIAELESQLPALEEEIDTLEDQLDELTKKKNSVEIKYSGLRSTVEEYKLMTSFYAVDCTNSTTVYLTAKTRTTPLMDNFYYSDKQFLVLKYSLLSFVDDNPSNDIDGSLVVAKFNSAVDYALSGLTITDLKKEGIIIANFVDDVLAESPLNHYYYLCTELKKVFAQNPHPGDKFMFDHPVQLGAQIYEDQEGFGIKDYDYGTLYGKTTTFLIIGAIF